MCVVCTQSWKKDSESVTRNILWQELHKEEKQLHFLGALKMTCLNLPYTINMSKTALQFH